MTLYLSLSVTNCDSRCENVWTFRPIPPPENPTLTSQDATIIIPSLQGCGEELRETIRTILVNEPYQIFLVTIDANRANAQKMLDTMPASKTRIQLLSIPKPNKRRQMVRAIPEVRTEITIFVDDDVTWPRTELKWMLAVFEKDPIYGGVATCQRLRRVNAPMFSMQKIWDFLGALYLERRNFDCAATTHVDGGMPCLSGRTVAYRTKILQDREFTMGFTNEEWWFGRYELNADDDNFLSRWMVTHGWETYFQYHPEAEIQTTLEDNPKFLKQCVRWSRSNWRSNLTTLFQEHVVWLAHEGRCSNWTLTQGVRVATHSLFSRQPWSTYAVFLTTLSPPAFIGDLSLILFLYKGTEGWSGETRTLAMQALLLWMFVSKFIKLLGHYIRYPADFLLLPVSILFGYLHGIIKVYAAFTLNVTTWGSREGADVSDTDRMKEKPDYDNSSFSKARLLAAPQ
ncbi:glycosyl transferase, group 2 family protein [Coccidioides posadasii C735 delta SOWgp]|uniref:Glycosyl transferase, group 2 family protein n=1 Tax=Coccidioides posadasii (strain C735) TaxID=222929 RepID=C5PB15_COCP7|nr:glycosyl transferase, group 2 family protein [Coccidioides posadasii C735 delta SOWgp]EER25799.1 glycosyl transferase, group 2 family protein [Coccidioides posadasii C735 delta SOWgp]|eukprot:XP_003067944.1 glycosyl transferase, group 2 family protein [Coccidioides posadasii C735 delta SOWgp]